MRLKYLLILMLCFMAGFTLLNNDSAHANHAPGDVECTNISSPGRYFPRFNLGSLEESSCSTATTWLWLSEYWSGSPLDTTRSNLRIFYSDAQLASLPYTFDTIRFNTLWTSMRCGSDVEARYAPTNSTFVIRKSSACGPTPIGSFTVNKGHLTSNTPRYGPGVSYVDIELTQLDQDTNAPISVNTDLNGARISFREQSLSQARSSATPPQGQAFALWSSGSGRFPVSYNLNFAPDCRIGDGVTERIYLKWYDADDGPGGVSGTQPLVFEMVLHDMTNNTEVLRLNSAAYDFGGDNEYRSQAVNVIGGHNYRWTWHSVTRNNGIQVYMPFSEVNTTSLVNCDVPVSGCTDPAADNYNAAATVDDGSCFINGCTNPAASNYDPRATRDDGSCNLPPSGSVDSRCIVTQGQLNAQIRMPFTTRDVNRNDDLTVRTTGDRTDTRVVPASVGAGTIVFSVPRRVASYNFTITATDGNSPPVTIGTPSVTCSPPSPPRLTLDGTPDCDSLRFSFSGENFNNYRMQLLYNGSVVPGGSLTGRPGSYNFDTAIHNLRDFNSKDLSVNVYYGDFPSLSDSESFRIGPCLDLVCGDVNNITSEVGQQFSVRFTVRFTGINGTSSTSTGPSSPGSAYSLSSVGFSGLTGITGPSNGLPSGTIGGSQSTLPITVDFYTAPQNPGTADVRYAVQAGEQNVNCGTNTALEVVELPYFKVYESDILSGGAFGTGTGLYPCETGTLPTPTGGRILGFTGLGGGDLIGASAQYALAALGEISNVFSQGTVASNQRTPLTFANSGVGAGGGDLGGSHCISNYWRTVQQQVDSGSDPFNSAGNNINLTSNSAQQVYAEPNSGVARINGGNISQSKSVYINGDAFISSDVVTPDTWTDPDDIDLVYIIAKGDIFIDASVSRIDALIVALPADDGTKGRIFTCRTNAVGLTADSSSYPGYAACNNQLVVNGGLVAKEVHLGRTLGSINRDSTPGELPATSNAAEVIHMSLEYFVGRPPQDPIRSSLFGSNSVQNLPPVF